MTRMATIERNLCCRKTLGSLPMKEELMSESTRAKPIRSLLKKFTATAFLVCLFGVLSLGAGVCQQGWPAEWTPYTGGRYSDQLQKIISAYRISENKISHAHFELSDTGVGPVDLFRIPDQSAD